MFSSSSSCSTFPNVRSLQHVEGSFLLPSICTKQSMAYPSSVSLAALKKMKPTCSLILLLLLAARQSRSQPCCSAGLSRTTQRFGFRAQSLISIARHGRTLSSRRRRTANVRTRAPMPCTSTHAYTGTTRTWNAGKRGLRRKAHSPQHFCLSRQFCHPRCSDGSRARVHGVHRRPSVRFAGGLGRIAALSLRRQPVIAWMPAERSCPSSRFAHTRMGSPASHRVASQREAAARREAWGESKITSCSLIP
ncbi:hypothetical protein C8Q74DRAFT_1014814 [Fomes fomentarius]|nr:hypothetical protein C8Q74DRAFT_1014814 [Fomes fomentarius]